jgi:hypothetical protein
MSAVPRCREVVDLVDGVGVRCRRCWLAGGIEVDGVHDGFEEVIEGVLKVLEVFEGV